MRIIGECVELTRDCELGSQGERAVVTALDDRYMTLVFHDRDRDREIHTGADYKFLRRRGFETGRRIPGCTCSDGAKGLSCTLDCKAPLWRRS